MSHPTTAVLEKKPSCSSFISYTAQLRILAKVHYGWPERPTLVEIHSIVAAGCGHHLYSLPTLIDGANTDNTTLLCTACEAEMREELTSARVNIQMRLQAIGSLRSDSYYTARARYMSAARAVANFENYNTETMEMQGMTTPKSREGKCVSFAEVGHRPEDEYRPLSSYYRSCPAYRPGRYADYSGVGHADTSFMNAVADWEVSALIEQVGPDGKIAMCRIV